MSRRDFVYSDHTSFVHRMMMMMHGKPHEFYELISPHAGTHHVRLLVHNGPPFEFMRMNPPPFAALSYQGFRAIIVIIGSKDGLFSKLEIKIVNGIKRFRFL